MQADEIRFLFLSAGASPSWNMTQFVKQMVPVGGEPLQVRNVRLLEEMGFDPLVLTSEREIMDAVPGKCVIPVSEERIEDTILSARGLWRKRTIYLSGDVVFFKDAYEELVKSEGTCIWRGKYGIVAVVLDWEDRDRFVLWVEAARADGIARGRSYLHSMLYRHEEFGFSSPFLDRKFMFDFDNEAQYRAFLEAFEGRE